MLAWRLRSLLRDRTETFKTTCVATSMSRKLWSFYEKQLLCDITLIPAEGGSEIKAHTIILCSVSEFFLKMLSTPNANFKEVKLTEIDGVTLKAVVEFMYKGEIELTSNSVETVLKAADFLQIETLKDVCGDCIVKELNATNCLSIMFFANERNMAELQEKAHLYACRNYERVCTEEDFPELKESQLRLVLSRDELYASSEEVILGSLDRWVNHDKENRVDYLSSLKELIRNKGRSS